MVFCILISCTTGKPTLVRYDCPEIVFPDDPPEYVSTLSDKSAPNEVTQAWVATALSYRNWNKAVRDQIKESK
jgi:hypothetical protein